MKNVLVWDLPIRLFHWSLVVATSTSFITALVPYFQDTELHMKSGYAVCFLVLFRIGWGVFGTTYARFSQFVKAPRTVLAYLKTELFYRPSTATVDEPLNEPGHNPLGGWMIILMLVTLALQVTSGLFANDDIMYEGPLAYKVSADLSSLITGWHLRIYFVTGFLILLHVGAIAFYYFFKRQNLVRAMITGTQVSHPVSEPESPDASQTTWWHAIIVALCACLAVYAIVKWL